MTLTDLTTMDITLQEHQPVSHQHVSDQHVSGPHLPFRPVPLFDKLSITQPITPDRILFICEHVSNLIRQNGIPGSRIKSSNQSHINFTFEVPFQGVTRQTVHAQIGRYGFGTGYRFEFNPHKAGRAGIADILAVLGRIIPDQDPITFLQHSTVTRVDIAIDVPELVLDQVIIRLKGARKHGVYTGPNGDPETVYLGGARSNRSTVYNKDLGGETSSLRIERRLKPRVLLSELVSIPNPFLKVQVTATAPLRGLITSSPADTLFDSMRLRGIRKALQFFPPDQRRILQAAINDPANSLMPSAQDIWEQWPQALQDVGLLFHGHVLSPAPTDSISTPTLPTPVH